MTVHTSYNVSLPPSYLHAGRRIHQASRISNATKLGTVVNVDLNGYRIVWDDGSESVANQGRFGDAPKWEILPIVDTVEQVAEQIALAERVRAERNAEAERVEQSFKTECAELLAANPKLTQAPSKWCAKTAAQNIRTELKAAKIKASVKLARYSGGDSIRVCVVDGEQVAQALAIGSKYKGSSFDPMRDLKTSVETAWTTCFGSTDYVFLSVAG